MMQQNDNARGVSALLTYKQAAERLNISEGALRKRISQGKIPIVKLGPRSCRIDAEELQAIIDEGRHGPLR